MEIPKPNKPSLSGYVEQGKLLPWMWVDARMAAARKLLDYHACGTLSVIEAGVGRLAFTILVVSTGSAVGRNMERNSSCPGQPGEWR